MLFRKFAYILALAGCFGPSFLFIKVGGKEVPPMTLVALRLLLGSFFLFLLFKLKKRSFWAYRKHTKHFFMMAIFSCVFPFFLITWSERTIESSLAGLINGSVPIFTIGLAHFFLPNDRLNKQKILGLLFGLVGLFFIFIPTLEKELVHIQGVIMVIVASISYSIGMVYSKKYLEGLPSLVAPMWQLVIAAFMATFFALCFESSQAFLLPSFKAVGSIFGLAFFGTALAFIFYYRIIEIGTASDISFSTFFFPLIAAFLGFLFLKEQLEIGIYLGGIFILLGLGISTGLFYSLFLRKVSYSKKNRNQ